MNKKKVENKEKVKEVKTKAPPQFKTNFYRTLEQRLNVGEQKVNKIINNIQDELKKVELEWMHLKGMMSNPKLSDENESESQYSNAESVVEIGLDDANQINETSIDFTLNLHSESTNIIFSDSDSDIDDHLSEEECNENVF